MFKVILMPLLVILIIYYYRQLKKPDLGILFGAFWTIQIAFCVFFLNEVQWSYCGILWILYSVFAFSIGFRSKIRERYFTKENRQIEKNVHINQHRARVVLCILLVIGLFYAARLISRYGFSMRNLMNLSSLLDMSSSIAVSRYSGSGTGKSSFDTILLIFLYLGPMVGGYCVNFFREKRDKMLCIATLFPELIVLMSENTKAGMIACAIFWGAAYFVGYLKKNGRTIFISKKMMMRLIFLLLGFVLLLTFSMFLRIGEINTWSLKVVKNKFSNYLFGHAVAFDLWLGDNLFPNKYTFGATTFLGISKYFGFERVSGVYQEVMGSGGINSNVYTYFRGIITDYGVVGGILLFFFLGILTKYLYDKVRFSKKETCVSEALLIMILSFLIYFMASIFTYTSYICTFIVLPFVFKFIQKNAVRI